MQSLTRRLFVRNGIVGLGAALLATACGSASTPAAAPSPAATTAAAPSSSQPAPAATSAASSNAATKLIWTGWNVVDFFNPIGAQFTKENPDIGVQYIALPDYKKQTTMLAAGDVDDVLNTRDDDLAGYADAGFIVPLDTAFPGVKEVNADTYEGNLSAMTYKGKQYGLCYYTDYNTLMYNADMLSQLNLTAPPANLDELKQQAMSFKDKKVADFPIYMWLQQESNFKEPMYAMMAASGIQVVDGNGNAVADNPELIKLLDWMVDAFQTSKIMDLANLNMVDDDTTNDFMAGKHVFNSQNRYDLRKLNDPKQSKVAVAGKQVFKSMIQPGLGQQSKGTVSWTRQYTVNAKSKFADAARKLQFFAGAKNKDGVYWTAKSLHDRYGLGFAYKSLATDADIVAAEKSWGDPDLFTKQKETAAPRQGLQAPWYSEWDNAMQAEWHKAILKQQTSSQSVKNIAEKWTELQKQNGNG
ncbi:MAG TPA: hypothetical protein VFZ25_17300 [Chloroflexota bacterium]|nr:hypothetical protein [Chloroflexota bacterium]